MALPLIPGLDENARAQAADRQARLTKPAGALGDLEALSLRLAAMTGRWQWQPVRKAVMVCAGDHGVALQGVSRYPQAVTGQMVQNFLRGGAAINVFARQMDARVIVVDAGCVDTFPPQAGLVSGKIAPGTADFTHGPAMTPEQAQAALQLGLDVLHTEYERGLDIVAVGEMGIGNTTSASAIISLITGQPPRAVTGHGTGIDETAFEHKVKIIEQGLRVNHPIPATALQQVGGFEIGAMAGVMIGAASRRIPVLIDGLISTAAALIAVTLAPAVRDYLVAAHHSVESGHQAALAWLGLTPLLNLNLRLGEGTGAVLAFPLVEAAMRALNEMATFDEAGVSGPAE